MKIEHHRKKPTYFRDLASILIFIYEHVVQEHGYKCRSHEKGEKR